MTKKTFYTERDIEDLVSQGTTNLAVHDDIVLTDLAREKATRLGLMLIEGQDTLQAEKPTQPSLATDDLSNQIKAKVIAHIGNRIPEDVLDIVIARVLAQLGFSRT